MAGLRFRFRIFLNNHRFPSCVQKFHLLSRRLPSRRRTAFNYFSRAATGHYTTAPSVTRATTGITSPSTQCTKDGRSRDRLGWWPDYRPCSDMEEWFSQPLSQRMTPPGPGNLVKNLLEFTRRNHGRHSQLAARNDLGDKDDSDKRRDRAMRMKIPVVVAGIAVIAVLLSLSGCGWSTQSSGPSVPAGKSSKSDDRNAKVGKDVPGGDSSTRIVYLKQNWKPEESLQFYFTSQGSQIVPYDWFLVLESAADESLLRDDRNMLKFGYLLQKKDNWNPDALPVGFVKDDVKPRAWLGLTCAACHTSQINYEGVGYRIDGGPSLADVRGFLFALVDALKATRDQRPKFDRFADKVLKGNDSPAARDELKEMLAATIDRREGYKNAQLPG